jgi:hypothetical protein
MGFWVEAQHGAEGLGEDGEGDVAVPAGKGAAFEVVQSEAGFEFAVVVFYRWPACSPPPDSCCTPGYQVLAPAGISAPQPK